MNAVILVVDDEVDLVNLLKYNLEQEHFKAVPAYTGEEALEKAEREVPDLIILDLLLPDISGIEVCRILRARESTCHIPILMLTAKGEEVDRVVGFEIGADDYVVKPFSPREVLLRVKAILRRASGEEKDELVFHCGPLVVDVSRHEVTVKGKEVRLTRMEFDLLVWLVRNRGRVQSRSALLDAIWGYDEEVYSRTIDTHVMRLRQKLREAGQYIETIRGMGYRFRD